MIAPLFARQTSIALITFGVLTGSTIRQTETNSMLGIAKKKRKELQALGVIVDFVFVQDYVFPNASAAACVVVGASKSGSTF